MKVPKSGIILGLVDYSHSNFLFSLRSMNAPVMVELEGETDPLEVTSEIHAEMNSIFIFG